jgi:hypothetical protein
MSGLILTPTSSSTRVVFQTNVVYQAKIFASKQDVYQVGRIAKRMYTEVPLYNDRKSFCLLVQDGKLLIEKPCKITVIKLTTHLHQVLSLKCVELYLTPQYIFMSWKLITGNIYPVMASHK